jgi:hypothetical protein
MNRPIVAALVVALAAAVAFVDDPVKGRQGNKSFRLVYQSDTRGYYRPCG